MAQRRKRTPRDRRPEFFEVRRLDQLRTLASPVREEVFNRLARLGPASIGAVARSLGRKPQALYAHFAKLEEVGLIRRAGTRETGRRPEVLFETPGRHARLLYDPRDARKRRALADGVAAGVRRAERELRAAVESADARTRGAERDTLWHQRSGWVTRSELARINAHLAAVERLLDRALPARGTTLQAVVLGLYPAQDGGAPEQEGS